MVENYINGEDLVFNAVAAHFTRRRPLMLAADPRDHMCWERLGKGGGHHFYVKPSSVTTNPQSPARRDRVWRLALELLPHASFASPTTFTVQPMTGVPCLA